MQAFENPQQESPRPKAVESSFVIGGPPQDEHNKWEELLDVLRGGVWLDIEVILNALEEELKALSGKLERPGDRRRANCLAKLRIAIIYGQIQSAPEIDRADPDTALWEWVNETAEVFPLFRSAGRSVEDLAMLSQHEFEYIREKLIPEMARKAKETKRDAIEMVVARLPTPYRQISKVKPSPRRLFVSSVLVSKDMPANGRSLADEVLRDMYPMFQYFGKKP